MLSKLSSCGIQGKQHTWFTDFLYSRNQRAAHNIILSSPLPVKAAWSALRQCSGSIFFLIFINYLSGSLENPLSLFADDSSYDLPHPSEWQSSRQTDRQAAASSLSSDLDIITTWSTHLEYIFQCRQMSHSHYLSLKGPYGKRSHLLFKQSS